MDFALDKVLNSAEERFNHLCNVEENMEKFKRKCEVLHCRSEDVKSKIKTELRPTKRLKQEVENWLTKVRTIIDEKQTIETEVQTVRFYNRSRLGQRIAEKLVEVEELFQKGIFSDGLVLDAPLAKGIIFPTPTLVMETTAKRNGEKIWEDLMSTDIPYFGLYGMGGSGKTTILKHIQNRVIKESDKFDRVIWITASKATNVIRLQNGIATALKLDISKLEDEATRAAWLYNFLKEEKRFVLILDDLWDAFDLQDVGIPEPTVENGCKLILTTRSLEVCRRMSCKCIKMELLSEEEAWNLFLDKVGRDVILTPELEAIAKDVAKECARLPLAIVTIGRSMKGVVDRSEWRNVLRELKRSTKGINDMEKRKIEMELEKKLVGDDDKVIVDRKEELDGVGLSSSMMVPVYTTSISPNNGKFRHCIKSWQKGRFLGSGSFGTVYEGYTDDGYFFAVKEVSLLDKGSHGQNRIRQLEHEISLLRRLDHENIVQYLGTDKDEARLYIFLELVTKGSLASLYQTYTLPDKQVSSYTRQILNGLKYLHEKNVVHRDIKCANILVDASGSVKLADFGLAKTTNLNDLNSSRGTSFWMAPEVVMRPKKGYGLAADIWSLGCTVLEMLTRQIPYSPLEAMQALFMIGKGEPPPVPDSLSRDARDLIYKCLQVNPDNRPTAAELLEHSFVKTSLQANPSPASPHYYAAQQHQP